MTDNATKSQKPVLGFAGLGKMGKAMALNLLKAGFTVLLYNRSPAAVEEVIDECVAQHYPGTPLRAAASAAGGSSGDARGLAGAHIVFSILANDAAFEAVVDEGGLLDALSLEGGALSSDDETRDTPDLIAPMGPLPPDFPTWMAPASTTTSGRHARYRPIHVNCATVSVALAKRQAALHAAKGVEYVAMPVLGRPDAAAAAALVLLYAGSTAAVRAYLTPLVLTPVLGRTLRCYGAEAEKANVMKIAFNFAIASAIETLSEGCALVQKHGIDPADYTDLLTDVFFDCPVYKGYGKLITQRAFLPAGATLEGVGLKDSALALAAGEDAGVPMPYATVFHDKCAVGITDGMGQWDWSCLAVVAERQAGIHRDAETQE